MVVVAVSPVAKPGIAAVLVASRAKNDEASALHEHVFDSHPSTVKQLAKALDDAQSAYAVFVTFDCRIKLGVPVMYAGADPVPETPVPATAVPFTIVSLAYWGANEKVEAGAHFTPDAMVPIPN